MTETKDMTEQESKLAPEARGQERAMRPPADIFEDDAGISVQADMPGVSKDRLEVRINSDTLSIEGSAVIAMPDDMEAIHADIRSTRYSRSFSLSRELDIDKIEANLKDGVLTLRIPKREEHQTRKIEVCTA